MFYYLGLVEIIFSPFNQQVKRENGFRKKVLDLLLFFFRLTLSHMFEL